MENLYFFNTNQKVKKIHCQSNFFYILEQLFFTLHLFSYMQIFFTLFFSAGRDNPTPVCHGGSPYPLPSLRKPLPPFTSLLFYGYMGADACIKFFRKNAFFQRGVPLQSKVVPKSKKIFPEKFCIFQK